MSKKRSFFERLTGSMSVEDEPVENRKEFMVKTSRPETENKKSHNTWIEEENEEAELSVDVYQTPSDIVVQTMVAGVKPEDLEISIASANRSPE